MNTPRWLLSLVLAAVPTLGACAVSIAPFEPNADAATGDATPRDATRPDALVPDVPVDARPPADVPAPPDANVVGLGDPCSADGGSCAGTLTCIELDLASPGPGAGRRGVCSTPCVNNASQATERSECDGTGSTCLASGDEGGPNASTLCTRSCRAGATNSGCRADQVCTGLWASHAMGAPDAPGCVPFCHSDAECAAGQHCNQLGGCQATAVDTSLRRDGLPCDPAMEPSTGPSTQCQGACFPLSDSDAHSGVCASAVDLANPPTQDTNCPMADGPRVLVQAPQSSDNLGFCAFQQCNCDTDCMAPFVCVQQGGLGICIAPDVTMGQHGTPTCP